MLSDLILPGDVAVDSIVAAVESALSADREETRVEDYYGFGFSLDASKPRLAFYLRQPIPLDVFGRRLSEESEFGATW